MQIKMLDLEDNYRKRDLSFDEIISKDSSQIVRIKLQKSNEMQDEKDLCIIKKQLKAVKNSLELNN